jgi:hypothetical protein
MGREGRGNRAANFELGNNGGSLRKRDLAK